MKEWFIQEVNNKLILFILLIIGGVIFVIKRIAFSALEKHTALRTIEKIKMRSSYAREIADSLDICYKKKEDFTLTHFELLKKYLREQTKVGDYQIHYITEVTKLH